MSRKYQLRLLCASGYLLLVCASYFMHYEFAAAAGESMDVGMFHRSYGDDVNIGLGVLSVIVGIFGVAMFIGSLFGVHDDVFRRIMR